MHALRRLIAETAPGREDSGRPRARREALSMLAGDIGRWAQLEPQACASLPKM